MSIEKKSLINTLKTTKKANVAKEELSTAGTATDKSVSRTGKHVLRTGKHVLRTGKHVNRTCKS